MKSLATRKKWMVVIAALLCAMAFTSRALEAGSSGAETGGEPGLALEQAKSLSPEGQTGSLVPEIREVRSVSPAATFDPDARLCGGGNGCAHAWHVLWDCTSDDQKVDVQVRVDGKDKVFISLDERERDGGVQRTFRRIAYELDDSRGGWAFRYDNEGFWLLSDLLGNWFQLKIWPEPDPRPAGGVATFGTGPRDSNSVNMMCWTSRPLQFLLPVRGNNGH